MYELMCPFKSGTDLLHSLVIIVAVSYSEADALSTSSCICWKLSRNGGLTFHPCCCEIHVSAVSTEVSEKMPLPKTSSHTQPYIKMALVTATFNIQRGPLPERVGQRNLGANILIIEVAREPPEFDFISTINNKFPTFTAFPQGIGHSIQASKPTRGAWGVVECAID
jgi:hypothetical protein